MEVMSHYNIRRIVDIYGAVQDRDLGDAELSTRLRRATISHARARSTSGK